MSARLVALRIDALDPAASARFWAELFDWPEPRVDGDGSATLVPPDDTGFDLVFVAAATPKREKNQMHFDVTSESQEAQDQQVAHALALGGRHIDVGQLPEELHVVLADPEGDEFCVVEPGNSFLADCGRIGALSSDGTQAEGYFWAAALDWPLVWDQDEETAVRSPAGGPKITWGGPPIDERHEPNRWRLALEVEGAGADALRAETARLVALGARVVDDSASAPVLASPDGNLFHLSAGR
ncbi:VOC family protein [Frondihabitans australicus]|uniref:Glyoxalase-like domain-containing protein n=1 Tax=Frondihabitans australicus TaxID=386892 RepID=A0A495ID98_9MICO|nr:VOC family protein [Frondihabitans australicus]RKR73983.1 hypothetical protein C8E83_1084 [Frondihabitans australicus]